MSKTKYITTPIFYVNDAPHIGHAYTGVIADIISRYFKNKDQDIFLSTGTDEHGIKVQKSALRKSSKEIYNKDIVQEFTNTTSAKFKDMLLDMNVQYNKFVRTTSKEHIVFAQKFWNILDKKGYIYMKQHEGWYSEKDEVFVKEEDITDEGKTKSGDKVIWTKENVHFFKLSAFKDKLEEYYKQNADAIFPNDQIKSIQTFWKDGLTDLCISRSSVKWGIQVPGYPSHTMYVWIDALTNYLSSIKYDLSNSESNAFWPCDLHIIGKDILNFHAIYWPALLMAADIPLPKKIISHGWWLCNNKKMSKSIGNTLSHQDLLKTFSSDVVRFCLIYEKNIHKDGNISADIIKTRYNDILGSKIGSLVQRITVFIEKNNNSIIYKSDIKTNKLILSIETQIIKYTDEMNKYSLHKALKIIMDIVQECHVYLSNNPVWEKSIEENIKKEILFQLTLAIYYIAALLDPFMPDTSKTIFQILNINHKLIFTNAENLFNDEHKINTPQHLFPKIAD